MTTIHRIWTGDVNRWHHSTEPRLRNSGDTIHAHSCRVMILGWLIFGDDWTREDCISAAFHDVAESWTGDPSYEAKRTDPAIREAHAAADEAIDAEIGIPPMSMRVKLCDGLDCILWATQHAPGIMQRFEWVDHRRAVTDLAAQLGVKDKVLLVLADAATRG